MKTVWLVYDTSQVIESYGGGGDATLVGIFSSESKAKNAAVKYYGLLMSLNAYTPNGKAGEFGYFIEDFPESEGNIEIKEVEIDSIFSEGFFLGGGSYCE